MKLFYFITALFYLFKQDKNVIIILGREFYGSEKYIN